MVLEAGFAALLHRYTGQADILVGTSISGRTQTETERLIGCFLNSVVLRSRFDDAETFRSLLHQVRERALGASLHSDLPFQRLVATLAPGRDLSRSPLFQVMFILHNPDGVSRVSKVSDRRELETGTSKFDLTLCMSETDSGLEGLMEYSTDLFERETIQRLCRHFGILLGAIADDPDQLISRLSMLSDADRHQLLVEWNDTAVSWPGEDLCLPQLFERQARRAPDAGGRGIRAAGLDVWRAGLPGQPAGESPGGPGRGPGRAGGICWWSDRSTWWSALLGILKAGGAYVPLDPTFPPDRLAYMVEDSKVGALITHRNLDQTLPHPAVHRRPPRPRRGRDCEASHRALRRRRALHRHHLAYVLYTSGSTGMPKGVAIAHSRDRELPALDAARAGLRGGGHVAGGDDPVLRHRRSRALPAARQRRDGSSWPAARTRPIRGA